MVQVDVFWSYAIGAGFALAAGHQLRAERPRPLENRYLSATVLYAAALFAPSGIWLLWGFPSWETMQVAPDRDALPAWLVALFAITNVTQAVVGFLITQWLIVRNRGRLAYAQLVGAYFGMFFILVHGWDGTGYRRFFSADQADFQAWTGGHVAAWLTSPVALTLYGMGVVLIPVLLLMIDRFHAEPYRAGLVAGQRRPGMLMAAVLGSIFGVSLGGAILASVLIHLAGWYLGVLAFAVLAGVALVPKRGLLARLVGWAALPA